MKKLIRITRIVAISLLFFTAINAIIAGSLFIISPSGELIGMSTSYLITSPFKSFLIPGITLFMINGVMNVIAAILSIKSFKYYPIAIIIQALLLIGWIIIQVVLVNDFNALHFTMLSIGIVLLICGWFLSTKPQTT